VLKIVSVTGGVADIDSNGDAIADDMATLSSLGITTAERQQLAQLYTPGQSLWRATLTYFSRWDCNWPGGPPPDAIVPNGPEVGEGVTDDGLHLDDPDGADTAGIEYQNQVVGQQADLVGAPFTLAYRSNRVPGRASAFSVEIPLSGATVPASLQRIDLEVRIAGQQFKQSFPPQPNLVTTFTWDGKDAYGRKLNGQHTAQVFIEFVYEAIYQKPASLAQAFGVPTAEQLPRGARPRSEFIAGRQWSGRLGARGISAGKA
jgi:hypothetical protein